MSSSHVLVAPGMDVGWCRGVLRGFMRAVAPQGGRPSNRLRARPVARAEEAASSSTRRDAVLSVFDGTELGLRTFPDSAR